MLDEVTAHSFVNVGVGAGVWWDSNAAAFASQGYSQTQFVVTPSLKFLQTRPTLTWHAEASGILATANSPGYYTNSNPVASAGFLYQISRRWQLEVNDRFLYTADPFQQYLAYTSTPTFNQPNPTVYVPTATTESNSAVVNLTYQIAAHDSLTFTGTEGFTRYLHTTYSAYNIYSWGGVGAYQHFFSARLSAGGAYSFTSLDFGHGQSRSGVQVFEGFVNYKLSQHMSLSGWIGPEYTTTKNLVPIFCTPYGCFIEVFHNSSWTTAFGGFLIGPGNEMRPPWAFQDSISDGGILLGIVQLFQVPAITPGHLIPAGT